MEIADYGLIGFFTIPISYILLDIFKEMFFVKRFNTKSNLIDFRPIPKKELKTKFKFSYEELIFRSKYKITNRQFEWFCAFIFEELGYKAQVTSSKNDKGKDIILNDGQIVVECKQYTSSIVGREICQKLVGAGIQAGAKEYFVITTGHYNKNAYEIAKSVEGLKLIRIQDIVYNIDIEKLNLILEKTMDIRY